MANIVKIITLSMFTISMIKGLPIARYSPPGVNPTVALGAVLIGNNRSQSSDGSGLSILYAILILLSIPLGLFLLFWICIGCYICTDTLLEKLLDICRRNSINCCFCKERKETNEVNNQEPQLSTFKNCNKQHLNSSNKTTSHKIAILKNAKIEHVNNL